MSARIELCRYCLAVYSENYKVRRDECCPVGFPIGEDHISDMLVAYEVCSVVGALVRWGLLVDRCDDCKRWTCACEELYGGKDEDALTAEEWKAVMDAIIDPRGPTEALRRAMKRKR